MRRNLRALAIAMLALPAALGPGSAAHGTDLEGLRARAQKVADRVTTLEHRLEDLNIRARDLTAELGRADRELALSHLQLREAELAYEAAQELFVQRAVDAYKASTSSDRLELILSAENMSTLALAARINSRIADADTLALEEMAGAAAAAQRRQDDIDERKHRLISLTAQIESVRSAVADTVATRRAMLRELTERIEGLEAEARAAAAAAAPATIAGPRDPGLGGPAPEVPEGFIGTGVTFEGISSWYGPGFEGNPTASGDIFDPMGYTAASRDLPLGTWLHVVHEGRGVVVLVNDRGPFIDDRVLDLSQGAAEAIGITGLGWVRAEIIIESKVEAV